MKISRDNNGNKTLKVTARDLGFAGHRGFTVQTNGNLPECHRMEEGDVTDYDAVKTVLQELERYVRKHGTERQKHLMQIEG